MNVVNSYIAPRNFAYSLEAITGIKELEEIKSSRPVGANLPALGLSNKAVLKEKHHKRILIQD